MEHGICGSEITDCNGKEFPSSVDLSLSPYSEFLHNWVFFCLGDEQNSIFISLMSKILFIHPFAYTSLLLTVQSSSALKGQIGLPLVVTAVSLLFSLSTLLVYFLHAYLKNPLEK